MCVVRYAERISVSGAYVMVDVMHVDASAPSACVFAVALDAVHGRAGAQASAHVGV